MKELLEKLQWFLIRDKWVLGSDRMWFIHAACGQETLIQYKKCPRCNKRMKRTAV